MGVRPQKVQQIIKETAAKAGIEIELKSIPPATFYASGPGNPDTFTHFYADLQLIGYPSAGGPDPEWLLGRFTSWEIPQKQNKWQGQNAPRWRSDEYDQLFRAAQTEMDPVRRTELFIRLNDQLVQGGAVIPYARFSDVAAMANSLHGVGLSGWDLLFWRLPYWYRQA